LERPCKNILAVIIRVFHHFIIFFMYFGFIAPIKDLWLFAILTLFTVLSWLIYNNKCFLTIYENLLCNKNKNKVFPDLTLYMSKTFDDFMQKIRIPFYIIILIVILMRLYSYYDVPQKIEIHGHRGARGNYPENTLTGFKYAIENDIDILELDLQLTKDDEIIIYHDKNINPDICINGIGDIPIKSLTLNDIKKYDCATKLNISFPLQKSIPKEQIPTFKELLEMVNKNYNKPIQYNVEIKTTPELDSADEVKHFVNMLVNIIDKYDLTNKIIVQSFDKRALKYIKTINPIIKTSLLIENEQIDNNVILLAKELNVNIISPDFVLLDKKIINDVHTAGFKVIPWTINDIDTLKKMIEYKVDGVITDYPVTMRNYIMLNL